MLALGCGLPQPLLAFPGQLGVRNWLEEEISSCARIAFAPVPISREDGGLRPVTLGAVGLWRR